MNANSKLGGIIGILTVLVGFSSCGPTNEFVEPPPPEVTVALPEVKAVTVYDEFPGRTEALASVEVRARVTGFLDKIEMDPSTIVQQGDPLFLIEQEPFLAAKMAASGQLESAEAARDLAINEYKRKEQAFETGGVSELDRDASKANMDVSIAAVSIASANLEKAQIDLDYTDVRAPIAGRVSKTLVDVGNLVGGGDPTLLTTIVDDSRMFANFELTERLVLPYLPGRETLADPKKERKRAKAKVKLVLTDGSEYGEVGEIDFVDNTVDSTTGTIKLRAVFPNVEGALVPGMFVRVLIPDIDRKGEGDRILIPSLAIQRDIGGDFVLVVGDDDVVELRRVKAGRLLGERRIVDEGLKGTERIVVKGLQIARDGVKVTPVMEGEEEPAAPDPKAKEEGKASGGAKSE